MIRRLSQARERGIPEATVARLPLYLRALNGMAERGLATVSSEDLAAAAGVNSAKLRKDLSHLGSYGTRGVGYDVEYLVYQISRELGLTQDWPVAIVGIGNLGRALANYGGFASRGFRVAALLDADPDVAGDRDRGDRTVQHIDELEAVDQAARSVDRVHRDTGGGGTAGLRPARRRRGHQHPELRARPCFPCRTASTSARSTYRSSCRSSRSTSSARPATGARDGRGVARGGGLRRAGERAVRARIPTSGSARQA